MAEGLTGSSIRLAKAFDKITMTPLLLGALIIRSVPASLPVELQQLKVEKTGGMEMCLAFPPMFFKILFCCLCPLLLARLLGPQLLRLMVKPLQLFLRKVELILHRYASCRAC